MIIQRHSPSGQTSWNHSQRPVSNANVLSTCLSKCSFYGRISVWLIGHRTHPWRHQTKTIPYRWKSCRGLAENDVPCLVWQSQVIIGLNHWSVWFSREHIISSYAKSKSVVTNCLHIFILQNISFRVQQNIEIYREFFPTMLINGGQQLSGRFCRWPTSSSPSILQ